LNHKSAKCQGSDSTNSPADIFQVMAVVHAEGDEGPLAILPAALDEDLQQVVGGAKELAT
jgi:hypothetical protein